MEEKNMYDPGLEEEKGSSSELNRGEPLKQDVMEGPPPVEESASLKGDDRKEEALPKEAGESFVSGTDKEDFAGSRVDAGANGRETAGSRVDGGTNGGETAGSRVDAGANGGETAGSRVDAGANGGETAGSRTDAGVFSMPEKMSPGSAGSGEDRDFPRTGSKPQSQTSGRRGGPDDRGESLKKSGKGPETGAGKTKKARVPSYEEKISLHKKRLYRRTLIMVAAVIALLMTGIFLWMHRGYRTAELRRISTFTLEDGAEFAALGKNMIRYSGSGAVCMDRHGNTMWSVSYEMQQPIISVSGDVIAIANRSGYNVYVMNAKGVLGTIETMLPIHSIAAAENGEVAVIMNDTGATWVRLYSPEGREIAYIIQTMEENGYPISAAVSPDGETLCLSSVQMSNAAIKSNVSFYNFGREGKDAADHRIDYSDFIDEVIPYVSYIDDSTCTGISDKRLILFRRTLLRKNGSSSILFSEDIQGVFTSDSFIGLLFNNTSEKDQYRLDVYNKRGKKAGSVSFTLQYDDIKMAGDKIYIYNEEECQIFTLGGRCLFDGELGRPITTLLPGAGLGDLLVVTGGEIDSVRFH